MGRTTAHAQLAQWVAHDTDKALRVAALLAQGFSLALAVKVIRIHSKEQPNV